MYHFYSEASSIEGDVIRLMGEDVNHIKNVLRMHEGERIVVCDKKGTDYYSVITSIADSEVVAHVESCRDTEAELGTRLYLFQGLPKKDKMELIIQKAVELGVYEVIPVMTKRVIVKLEDAKKEAKRLERWQAIAESAAKQSGRGIIPEIKHVMSYKQALLYAKTLDSNVIPYENADGSILGMEHTRECIAAMREKNSVGIFIGPEGGFEENEVREAEAAGAEIISLGKRILRTETAGIAVLSAIMIELS